MEYNWSGEQQFCLGHPAHPVSAGEVICRVCGALVQDAQLGVYQVKSLLGYGRSGSAYTAVHSRLRQTVALKLLPPNPISSRLWTSAQREVSTVATLRHSSILPVYSSALWNVEDQAFLKSDLSSKQHLYLLIVMPYAPFSLTALVRYFREREPNGQARLLWLIRMLQQLGSALSSAHAAGVVHGAITPGNILFENQQHALVADFGFARLSPPPAPYLAPESYEQGNVSAQTGNLTSFWNAVHPASDQYALAILCHQLLSSLLPSLDLQIIGAVLRKATRQNPERRFSSVEVFVAELVTHLSRHQSTPFQEELVMKQATPRALPSPRRDAPPPQQRDAPSQRRDAPSQKKNAPPASPPPIINDWEKLAGKLFTERDYQGAVEAYQKAAQQNPSSARIWSALGDTYFALEEYAQALQAYQKALTLNPDDGQVWFSTATVLDMLKRSAEARAYYHQARKRGIE